MYANYHTHTTRCHHARGNEREYIETAISRGIKVLGFSDHVPYPFPNGHESGFRIPRALLEDYINTLLDLSREYADQIELHIGFEAEYYPAYHADLLAYLEPYPYEYLIMGQHFIKNEIDSGVYCGGRVSPDVPWQYARQVAEGLKTGDFTYLAHPDLPSNTERGQDYKDAMEYLCREALALDVPLELNFLGLHDGRAYPCPDFWEIAGRVGNKVIFGCDAHDPWAVAHPETLERAKNWADRYGLQVIDRVTLHRPIR
ncbi:MAG: histidinol-phosphatase [Clostridia bacterium]|nr:histidinol-phosphatase [Clostridia bacterium]